jgi:hypothetical protein
MVVQFMEGVDERYQNVVEEMIRQILAQYPDVVVDNIPRLSRKRRSEIKEVLHRVSSALASTFGDSLLDVRMTHYALPIVNVVAVLPKDELAAMAEALVNLTSVRRRLSFDVETVGGPIDVAVISKGDGFIWIRRKNYFDLRDNPHFMARYK